MQEIVNFDTVKNMIIAVRNQQVIVDSDVAKLYGVETKRINEAVKNNPERFPAGYVMELSEEEHRSLRSKISTLEKSGKGQHVKYYSKVFTEKGLYMLATILKSKKATQTTILIVETFAQLRELSRAVQETVENPNDTNQKNLAEKSGILMTDILGNKMQTTDTETSIELNLALLKVKHTVKCKGR
jgi:phage regulator Rha-like protein